MMREIFFYAKNHDDAIVLVDRLIGKGFSVDKHKLEGNKDQSVVARIPQDEYPFVFFSPEDFEYEAQLVAEVTQDLDAYSDGHGTGF